MPTSELLTTGRRIAHASRKLPPPWGGGSFLEEALALFIWFLDFLGNLTIAMVSNLIANYIRPSFPSLKVF